MSEVNPAVTGAWLESHDPGDRQFLNIGDVRSLAIHPASTTHSQLTPAEQITAGVTPGLVRLSVGIENIKDIQADLEKAFAAAK